MCLEIFAWWRRLLPHYPMGITLASSTYVASWTEALFVWWVDDSTSDQKFICGRPCLYNRWDGKNRIHHSFPIWIPPDSIQVGVDWVLMKGEAICIDYFEYLRFIKQLVLLILWCTQYHYRLNWYLLFICNQLIVLVFEALGLDTRRQTQRDHKDDLLRMSC